MQEVNIEKDYRQNNLNGDIFSGNYTTYIFIFLPLGLR